MMDLDWPCIDRIFRMLRSGAQASFDETSMNAPRASGILMKNDGFSVCSIRQRDFIQNFQDDPRGGRKNDEILRMLRTGARFSP